jgi:8-oxo-dGTP diphosphatase
VVAVVVVIFTVRNDRLEVLLIKRSAEPEKGRWALPGGLLLEGEGLDAAASRKLVEETGVHDVYLEQLYTFADLDPLATEGSVAVSYFAHRSRGWRRARSGCRAGTAWMSGPTSLSQTGRFSTMPWSGCATSCSTATSPTA